MTQLENHLERCFLGKKFFPSTLNTRSVINKKQYHAYQKDVGRKIKIIPPKKRLQGIGGKTKVIAEVTIQVPFKTLKLTIDVELDITDDDCPSLFSNRDIVENGLDISLQGHYLHIGGKGNL